MRGDGGEDFSLGFPVKGRWTSKGMRRVQERDGSEMRGASPFPPFTTAPALSSTVGLEATAA